MLETSREVSALKGERSELTNERALSERSERIIICQQRITEPILILLLFLKKFFFSLLPSFSLYVLLQNIELYNPRVGSEISLEIYLNGSPSCFVYPYDLALTRT